MTTAKERELLGLLQEECAEVIQIASKINRFGFDSYNPYDQSGKSNRTLLEDEIGDVRLIVKLLEELGAVDVDNVVERMKWKRPKLEAQGIAQPEPLRKEEPVVLEKRVMPSIIAEDIVGVSPMQPPSAETAALIEIFNLAKEIKDVPKTVWKRKYLLRQAAELVALIVRMPTDEN